jgi:hypothetical protein
MAAALADLAGLSGRRPSPRALASVSRWAGLVEGRGACHHPDGTARFILSGLRVFAAEIRQHQQGRCGAASGLPFLPADSRPAGFSRRTGGDQ